MNNETKELLSQVVAENQRSLDTLTKIVERLSRDKERSKGTLSIRHGGDSRKYFIGRYSLLREAAEELEDTLSEIFGLFFDFTETKVVVRDSIGMESAKWEIELESKEPLTPEEKEKVYTTEKRIQKLAEEGII